LKECLPALEEAGVKLYVVGIGSRESATEFGEALDFPLENLLVDESDESEAYRAAGTRNSQRDPDTNKQIFEGVESMWSEATNDALEQRGKEDLDKITGNLFNRGPYKPLMPKGKSLFDMRAIEKTLVQGGSFIFRGEETVLEHYDPSSGAHLPLDVLLTTALDAASKQKDQAEEAEVAVV